MPDPVSDSVPGGLVAGVDEAGRGPLAGPVVIAAVILPRRPQLPGLNDSKRVAPATRERLFDAIREQAIAYSVVTVEVEEIERVNILTATLNGMQRSVRALDPVPGLVMVDGNRAPELDCEVRTLVEGDRWVPAISAASILAKVTRDRIMDQCHKAYPEYGFDRHRGYATPGHLQRLRELGPCPIHRRSFAPVRELLERDLF